MLIYHNSRGWKSKSRKPGCLGPSVESGSAIYSSCLPLREIAKAHPGVSSIKSIIPFIKVGML